MNRTILVTLLALSSLLSPAKNHDINGVVVGIDGQPIPFVNVVLFTLDSTFVQGVTSRENGSFNIVSNVSDGILKFSCVGYETAFVNINDCNGILTLKEDSQNLSEIVVKAQRPKTRLTGNSMITSIQGSALEKSGTAKEMLAKVPGMTQKNDELEVLGKGKPVFYINGRKVNDSEELKRLHSSEIKEVEVITNPGAQYDATVSAVVRIKTVRKEGVGFGYDVNLSNQQDLRYGYSAPRATLNLRYRHKNIDFLGMVNYWKWNNVEEFNPKQKSYFMDNGRLRIIEQNSWLRNIRRGEGFDYNFGFNWQIMVNHSFGARIERHDRLVVPMANQQRTEMAKYLADGTDRSIESSNTYEEKREHTPFNWEGNMYYNGKVGNLDIDLNLDFLTNKTTEETVFEEWRNAIKSNSSASNSITNTMCAGKLILIYPIWQGQLQTGTEMIFVSRKNTYKVFGLSLPNSDSNVKENNIAAFVQYVCQVPKLGNVSVGFRYEHIDFSYLDKLNANNIMSRNTSNLYPSFSIAKQWGSWQTSLAYSVKTSRPSYWQLSETMNYINPFSLQQGDPKLKNATIHEVSTNVRWKWLNLYMTYEHCKDAITQWSYIYNDQGVILIKQINLADPMCNLAAFLTASPTFGCYSPNWTIGLHKFFYKYTLVDPREITGERSVCYNKPLGYFDLNNAFRFKHSWQLECNATIITPGDAKNFRLLNTSFNIGFVVQKSWFKNDALCLRASVTDVFQRNRQNVEMDCGYYTLIQHIFPVNHRLNVSLRYTFNAQKSKYKGLGAGQNATSRMKK